MIKNLRELDSKVILAFILVYLVWGSTYLAIRYAIETIPSWTLVFTRYFLSALILFAISFLKKEKPLTSQQIKVALTTGLFLVTANGLVCVVEYWVPSGIAAVVVGSMPIWILILNWLHFAKVKPTAQKLLGAVIGLVGVGLIASGGSTPPGASSPFAPYGVLILCGSSLLWSVGTLMQQKISKSTSVFRYTGLQLFSGALLAMVVSFIFEKPWAIDPQTISFVSVVAHLYLVIFGSVMAFTAYSWLSRNVEPHMVSTYALVNPVVAVGLGWLFYKEPVTISFLTATLLVLVGLALLMRKTKQNI